MTIRSLYTGASGMQVQEANLDTIANNLANASTAGFKRSRLNFEDLFYQYEKLPGTVDTSGLPTPIGLDYGLGARVAGTEVDQSQGTFTQTNGQLDLAISGQGFFQVQDPQTGKTLYTRAGSFSVNANGQVVLASADLGRPLQPAISIPPGATQITISGDGVVSVLEPPNTNPTNIGQIQTATFVNPQGLIQMGQNLYQQSDATGSPQTGAPGQEARGLLQQGYLEASNVDPTTELVGLINTQRTYELNSQVVQASDQILQLLTNLRRF
jgi:flagellar basal-body rod protein FlgG